MSRTSDSDNIIQISAVQLNYIPAWNVNYNCATEPLGIVGLWKDEQSISKIKQKLPSYRNVFDIFDNMLIESYTSWLTNRITTIIDYIEKSELDSQIIVFPEYSIPYNEEIYKYLQINSKGRLIIAGSHTKIKNDWSKTNEGLVFLNGERIPLEKLTLGKGEENGERGDKWNPIEFNGHLFGILFCSDFLQLSFDKYSRDKIEKEMGNLNGKKELKDLDVIIIPSLSQNVNIFDMARQFTENLPKSIPIVFVNTAIYGGTKIFCVFDKNGVFHEKYFTLPIPCPEEALFVIDINLAHQYVDEKTRYYSPKPSRVRGILPFIDNTNNNVNKILIKKIEELKTNLKEAKVDKDKINLVLEHIENNQMINSTLLKEKLMIYRNENFLPEDIDYLLDYIPFDTLSFYDMMYTRIGKSIKLLDGIRGISNPDEDTLLTEQIKTYKECQPKWDYIEQETKEKYFYPQCGCGSKINIIEAFCFNDVENIMINALSDIISPDIRSKVLNNLIESPLIVYRLIDSYTENMISNKILEGDTNG